ncbi:MAG: MarR family transcriptional regulator [Rhizobiaceae bacterium]|nr:MarR family transcriptional regulator [Rhizobiaceae bacterium]
MSSFVEKPPYWINRAAFLFRAELQRAFSADGIDLTPEEWALMMVLRERAPLSVGSLAELTLRDRTTVTRFLDTLASKGFVERKPDPADRRRMEVRLSPHALEAFPRMLAHVEALIARGGMGISRSEIETTISVLSRMIANLSASKGE